MTLTPTVIIDTREQREEAASTCRDYRDVYFYPAIARLYLESLDAAKRERFWQKYLSQSGETAHRLRGIGWRRLAGDIVERMSPNRLQAIRDQAFSPGLFGGVGGLP